MRRLVVLTAGLLAALAGPAGAYTVAGGSLDHRWVNVFDTTAPANTMRTWLGYSTGPTPSNANGTVGPVLPATGPTVSILSARGADQTNTWNMPVATGGTDDPMTRTGTLEFSGGIKFDAPPFPAGHGFTITFENPRVVLNGTSGEIFYSGSNDAKSGATTTPKTYDKTSPVYALDLTNATYEDTLGQTRITGIVPRIATEGYVYPATYKKDAGPERTPNTFGAFDLVVSATPVVVPPAGSPSPEPSSAPTNQPAPAATSTPPPPPPAASATATSAPATSPSNTATTSDDQFSTPPRASALRVARGKLSFQLTSAVPTEVLLERRKGKRLKTVRSRTVRPTRTRVTVKLTGRKLAKGRYRLTVTPEGGDSRVLDTRIR